MSVRRSILADLPDWPGWEEFLRFLVGRPSTYDYEDSRLVFNTIFQTGARESEAILIRPEMFRYNEEAIMGRIPLLKKRRKAVRDVIIKIDDRNPLALEFRDTLENCKTDYLLPRRRRYTREIVAHEHTSKSTVYRRITELHPDLWPHAIRGYRASMLVNERNFTVQNLVSWFQWTNANMAIHYTRTRDLAGEMGIKELPI